jgi:uncharacterized damage-inducible protein DinB
MPGQAPVITDEREQLLAYINQQRDGLRYAAFGLSDAQAGATPTRGTLSVGGLIKHVAFTEEGWVDLIRAPRDVAGAVEDAADAYVENFTFGPDDTLAGVLTRMDEVAAATEAVIRDIDDLDRAVPVPKGVPWYPQDLDAWTVRWVLLHLVEEIARHAGHADIVREMVDGATSFPLMAAAEGWPANDFLQPWTPDAV